MVILYFLSVQIVIATNCHNINVQISCTKYFFPLELIVTVKFITRYCDYQFIKLCA